RSLCAVIHSEGRPGWRAARLRRHRVIQGRTATVGEAMSRWALQPVVIGGVLGAVEEHLGSMNEAWSQEAMADLRTDAAAVGPVATDVAAALAAVLDAQNARLSTIGNRVSAGLVGVESAVNCFEVAQDDMLAECQSQMLI